VEVNRTLPASLLLLVALAGCSGPAPTTPAPAPAPAPARTGAQQEFLHQLLTIDPDLVDSPDKVLDRGENTCSERDKPADVRLNNTVARFSGAATVTADEARKILDAADTTICKAP
jgi:hypothetical protein